MDEHELEISEWRRLVGTTILSFGDIEFITIKCLAHLPIDKIYESASTLPFGRRVDLILEILEGRRELPNVAIEFSEKLK